MIRKDRQVKVFHFRITLPRHDPAGDDFCIAFNFVPMFGIVMAFQDYKPAKGFFDPLWNEAFKYLF
ncbi:MAG: hypothetical protein ACLUOI_35190 [Eisenbergiella sp.]